MRTKLLESAPQRKRSLGGTAVSTLLHLSLVGGAVVGTKSVTGTPLFPPPDTTTIVYHRPPERPIERQTITSRKEQIATNVVPIDALSTVDLRTIPEFLPPSNSTIGTVSFDSLAHTPLDTPAPSRAADPRAIFDERTVEHAVAPLPGNPAPTYPRMLAQAGIEGVVHMQFVVDTSGRVERGSMRAVRSDHTQFERAVRDVLERMRFSPAETGGQRVRQLVEQPFAFALRR